MKAAEEYNVEIELLGLTGLVPLKNAQNEILGILPDLSDGNESFAYEPIPAHMAGLLVESTSVLDDSDRAPDLIFQSPGSRDDGLPNTECRLYLFKHERMDLDSCDRSPLNYEFTPIDHEARKNASPEQGEENALQWIHQMASAKDEDGHFNHKLVDAERIPSHAKLAATIAIDHGRLFTSDAIKQKDHAVMFQFEPLEAKEPGLGKESWEQACFDKLLWRSTVDGGELTVSFTTTSGSNTITLGLPDHGCLKGWLVNVELDILLNMRKEISDHPDTDSGIFYEFRSNMGGPPGRRLSEDAQLHLPIRHRQAGQAGGGGMRCKPMMFAQ